MTKPLNDTDPQAERVQIEIQRSMSVAQKFQLINDMIMKERARIQSDLRCRFPNASPGELRRRLATVLLGPELATKVYGPEPDPPTVEHGTVPAS